MSVQESAVATPDASVVIVTHNNESLIADCLMAVHESICRHTYEVVLVDNASSDGTLAAIPESLAPSRLATLDANAGFARASNVGIRMSSGRFLVLVNSDAFPDRGSTDRLIETLDELPDAGIVGGRLRYPSGQPQPSGGTFPSLGAGLWTALYLHRLPLARRADIGVAFHRSRYRTRREVDWVTGAYCIARREVGELPTGHFMYGEDVAWSWKSRSAGMTVWVEPAATAVHIGRASVDRSQAAGFAQLQRVKFELAWFAARGRLAELGARAILVIHAVVRLAAFAAPSALRGQVDRRFSEYMVLLRAAVATPSPKSHDVDR